MPEPEEKTFILSDMPDYRQAVARIKTLTPQELQRLSAQVGLKAEYREYASAVKSVQEDSSAVRMVTGAITGLVAAGIVYLGVRKLDWGWIKRLSITAAGGGGGVLAGAFAAAWLDSPHAELAHRGDRFADQFATRLLEQQLAIQGEGPQLRLVSTAQPASSSSLLPEVIPPQLAATERYGLTPPQASYLAQTESLNQAVGIPGRS